MGSSLTRTRRQFLHEAAWLGAALPLVGRGLPLRPANDRLQLASIGVGGMGNADLGQFLAHSRVDVVALCDVDENNLQAAKQRAPKARTFTDWREMLAAMGDRIDAVNVATPDHTHAPASMSAIRLNKHVYCQKPLTHDVHEARALRLAAAKHGVKTQMGIQIHSNAEYRQAVAIIREGALGLIREVHSWSNKRWGYDGPAPTPAPVPANLHWNAWLGTAPERPYASDHYHPANWRKWVDFGCGTMGDMGIHILDPVASAIELGLPRRIVSHSPEAPATSHGLQNHVEYTFAATDRVVEGFKLTWSDGGMMPDTSAWPETKLPGQGSMFIGEKGYMLLPHVGAPRLYPEKAFADYERPRVQGANHWHLWVDACLGGEETTAGFDYSGPLTEVLLLGVVANRFPKQVLEYDAEGVAIPNFAEAHAMLRRTYREGFEVEGL